MEIVYYGISDLRNMKYPNQWVKKNKDEIKNKEFNKHLCVPIVGDIEGKKIPHILSEFEYMASEFYEENNSKTIPCIYYSDLSKEEAINLLVAQSNRCSYIDEIRKELELLTAEEKKLLHFYNAFNVDQNSFFAEINTRYEGQMRRITEKSLYIIYDKCRLDELFKPLNLELSQQVQILTAFTNKMVDLIEDERLIPKVSLIRYLWAIFEGALELMKIEQITFNSVEFDNMLKKINDEVITKDIERLIVSFNTEVHTYSLANRHKEKIKSLADKVAFNPFSL